MPARSPRSLPILLLLIAACGSPAPGASLTPTAAATSAGTAASVKTAAPTARTATPTALATPTARPTAAPTKSPSPSATAFVGPVVNADGSVWISQGGATGYVMAGDDAIWAISQDGNVSRDVVRIDPVANELETVVADLPVLPNPITGVGVNGYVWVASWDRSSVTQYDAETGEEIAEVSVGSNPIEPVYAYGDLWTTAIHGNLVTRIDTETAEVQQIALEPPGRPNSLQPIRHDLALVGNAGGLPYLIDPERMEVIGQFEADVPSDCVSRMAAIEGSLWAWPCSGDRLLVLNAETGEVIDEVVAPITADPPLMVDNVMWLPRTTANEFGHGDGRTWIGLDAETHQVVAEYEAVSPMTDGYYAIGFESIWMFGHEGMLRIPADTLRTALNQG